MVRPVMPLFEYLVDQEYIAAFLCLNTDKPELQVNVISMEMDHLTRMDIMFTTEASGFGDVKNIG